MQDLVPLRNNSGKKKGKNQVALVRKRFVEV